MTPPYRTALRAPIRLSVSSGAIAAVLALVSPAQAEPAPAYSELLRQAQTQSPRLAESLAQVRAAEGRAQQAAARPNPELGLEVENFGGSGSLADAPVETTLSVAQPLEVGGKRGARVAAARAEIDAARARQTQLGADYAFELANAYAEAEAADRRVALSEEAFELARDDLRATQALVRAGKEAELRSLQAQAAVTSAQAALNAAQAERSGAYGRLTALAGSPVPFTSVSDRLLGRPAGRPQTAADALSVPAVRAAQAEREAAARQVRLERTRAVPDVTASFGVRRFDADDSTAFVAGVSVPIPVLDQNRGSISAARAELSAAEARLNAARLDAEAELRTARFQFDAAQTREGAAVEGEATAAEAYRLTRVAYESGKASLIELNTARRALADARNQTIDAQLVRLRAEAGLARLQGRAPFGASE